MDEELLPWADYMTFKFSITINRIARTNNFRWALGPDNMVRLAVNRVPVQIYG